MDDSADAKRRGIAARIGICFLNLLHPGLGLIRLARYRLGFAFVFLCVAAWLGLLVVYSVQTQMTYASYLGIFAFFIVAFLIAFVGSLALSWRGSADLVPRFGRLWRWFGIVGLTALLSTFSVTVSDHAKSKYHNFHAIASDMAPTLEIGDRFIARMRAFEPISRGDVVVVRHADIDFVKRVVAVPGDTISIRDGVVVLNNSPVKLVLLSEEKRIEFAGPKTAKRFREQFPGRTTAHEIFDLGTTQQDNAPEVQLANGQYFVLGDNRDNSTDSRFGKADGGLGIVDRMDIKGRVLFRYWRSGIGIGEGLM
jgi:signal peptidase I